MGRFTVVSKPTSAGPLAEYFCVLCCVTVFAVVAASLKASGRSKVEMIPSHGSGKVVGIRNADKRQLAILFVVVQSVAYDELIRNLKSHIVRLK